MQITVSKPVKIPGSTKVENSFFFQRGMYKHYLLKHFGTFTIFIDHAMIEFQKHQLINHSNTSLMYFMIILIMLSLVKC